MKSEKFFIGNIPVILLGEQSDSVYLFVHGQCGSKEESVRFAEAVSGTGCQVLGIDLPEHGQRKDSAKLLPWEVVSELKKVYLYLAEHWQHICVRANSIGAWFSMLAFGNEPVEKCLFVSPVLDMERLITDMMSWANVSEEQLEREKEIKTDFGHTLSWDYLCYVRENRIAEWKIPTEILYADGDNMVRRETVDAFAEKMHCELSVMENGEHWFHTPEQLAFMKNWERQKR